MTIASKITSNAVFSSVNTDKNVAFGTLVEGDKGSKFVYVNFNAIAATTLQQGYGVLIDEEFNAFLAGASTAATAYDLGTLFGTVYLSAKVGNDGNKFGDTWNLVVPANSSQGIWVQTRGVSAAYLGAISAGNAVYYNYTSGATGQITQATVPTHAATLTGVGVKAVSIAVASTVVNANNTLTLPASTPGVRVGANASGTGINNGTYVSAIAGATVSLSNSLGLAPVSAAGTVTVTFASNKTWLSSVIAANTAQLAPAGPLNTFVGATVTDGTNTTTVTAIDGNSSKGWTLTLAAALATTASAVAITSTIVYEVLLNDPFVSANV